jgi:uracil-DNA glycosylase
MDVKIAPSWKMKLNDEFKKTYFTTLTNFVKEEYNKGLVFPPAKLIFNAFNLCDFDQVRVVILGQDPYHGVGQAHGLCFSVKAGVPMPPSLLNIFKEINSDLDLEIPPNGDLTRWASQGVFMLNATLTVRANAAGSHQNQGWETFTDAVVKLLSEEKDNLVFMLWGSFAQKKKALIDTSKHLVLESPHPSPLSAYRGFLGNRHFSTANSYLESINKELIKW